MLDHGQVLGIEEKGLRDDGDNYVLTGYGAIFGNVDLGNDVILPGAFAKSLRDHGPPLLLFNHDMSSAPIGTIVDIKEDKRGLWYKAELPKADDFVRGRIIPQLKNRGLKSNSIGYKPTIKSMRRDGVRELKEVRLYEVSLVLLGMNPEATVESVKRHGVDDELREAFELMLKNAGRGRHEHGADVLRAFAQRLAGR